ncbi:hypothetical protein [Zunongwangia sp.]|uniref:hypothetical protein n=1 Tax=Zunongwangia sp. TaxID=1965325 RepID=UPI003AA7FAF5
MLSNKLYIVLLFIISTSSISIGYSQTWEANNGNLYINNPTKVGIGTNSPQAPLHINNGGNSYGAILATSSESAFTLFTKSLERTTYSEVFRLGLKYNLDENNGFISFYRGGDTFGGFLGFSTNGIERLRISRNGNVGIGISNPDEKLTVNGSIHTKEVRVDVNGFSVPDYVFHEDFDLINLQKLKKYIEENHHLPNIPSALEFENKGMNLKQMNLLLLQKIEELTLYVLSLQEQVDQLKTQN